MAEASSAATGRVVAALSWAATAYVLLLVCGFYLGAGNVRRHHIESASFTFVALLLVLTWLRPARTGPPDPTDLTGPAQPWPRLAAAFIGGSLVLYWPILSSGLFADDYVLLEAARAGRLSVWSDLFRPVPLVLWRVVDQLTSRPALALHAINVALHGVNSLLIAVLARGLALPRTGCLWAGVMFLCCPVAVEPVAWPSGIQDVLTTTFVLIFLTLTVSGPATPHRLLAGGGAVLLALLTKEIAVAAAPLAAILGLRGQVRRPALIFASMAGALTATFLFVRFSLLPLPDTYQFPLTAYTIKELLVRPFATLAVPLRAAEARAFPALAIALVTIVVVPLRAAAGAWHRTAPVFLTTLTGGAMILLAIAPAHAVFYIDPDLQGSRYLYLGASGWAIVLVSILGPAAARPRAAGLALALCLVSAWVVTGRRHLHVWLDAAAERDRILAAAGTVAAPGCVAWAVYGLPAMVNGVPTFINGFPEAVSSTLRGGIRIAPGVLDGGECRLTWTGEYFRRD